MVDVVSMGLLLILAGFAAIVADILMSSKPGERQVKGGGVVLVGPIPIAFGSDAKWTSVAIALAIVLIIVTLLLYVI